MANTTNKYRVKNGTHFENGKTYVKGDIVESTLDLTKVFVNKFSRIKEDDVPEKEELEPALVGKGDEEDVPGARKKGGRRPGKWKD